MPRPVTSMLLAALLLLAGAGCGGDVPDYRKYSVAVVNWTGRTIASGSLEYLDGDTTGELDQLEPESMWVLPERQLEDDLPQRVALRWRYEGESEPVEKVMTLEPPPGVAWSRAWLRIQPDENVAMAFEQLPPGYH